MYNGTSGSQVGHNAAEERRGKIDGARGGHAGVSPVILGILLLTPALSAQGHIGISSKKTQELNSVQEMGRTAVEKETSSPRARSFEDRDDPTTARFSVPA